MNELKRLEDFKSALAKYHISDDSLEVVKKVKIVLLVAPTSTGRNTLINELLKSNKYHYIVSDTTRKPRINNGLPEQNGREYWFISENKFLENLNAGKYLEAAIIHNQQVSGISIKELVKACSQNKIAITDCEIRGVDNIVKVKPDTLSLFMLPPSFIEWQSRIKQRGLMNKIEYHRRMKSASEEFRAALEKDYYTFIVNDDFNTTIKEIEEMIDGKAPNPLKQTAAKKLVKDLCERTTKLLKDME